MLIRPDDKPEVRHQLVQILCRIADGWRRPCCDSPPIAYRPDQPAAELTDPDAPHGRFQHGVRVDAPPPPERSLVPLMDLPERLEDVRRLDPYRRRHLA